MALPLQIIINLCIHSPIPLKSCWIPTRATVVHKSVINLLKLSGYNMLWNLCSSRDRNSMAGVRRLRMVNLGSLRSSKDLKTCLKNLFIWNKSKVYFKEVEPSKAVESRQRLSMKAFTFNFDLKLFRAQIKQSVESEQVNLIKARSLQNSIC